MRLLRLLSGMVVPLILVVVGYGIRIRREGLGEVLMVVGLRYGLIIPLALILNHVVIGGLLGLPQGFQAAFFTLLVLPPPFIIPLFLSTDDFDEKAYVTNTLAVSTLVSLVTFAVYLGFNPMG